MKHPSSNRQRLEALLQGAAADPMTSLRHLRGAEEIEAALVDLLAQRAGVARARVSPTEPLANLGLDSLQLIVLVGDLEEALDLRLDPTFFWDYPTLRAVAGRVQALRGAAEQGAHHGL